MPEVSSDLRVFNDFERNPDLLKKFDKVLQAYSAAAIFADVQYRTGVMDSAIKPAFRAKVTGQAVTVQLSKGDLVDPLKALEMGQPGDVIVVDAGGDLNTSVCGGLMGGLAQNRGIRAMIVDGAGRDTDELKISIGRSGRAQSPQGERTQCFRGVKKSFRSTFQSLVGAWL